MVSGAYNRRKGHDFERALVHRFREAIPGAEVKRGLQSRAGGECPDVDAPPFWVEAKCGAMPNPRAALEQATQDAGPGRIPIAVIKDNRKEPFVCLSLEDFLEILRTWSPQ